MTPTFEDWREQQCVRHSLQLASHLAFALHVCQGWTVEGLMQRYSRDRRYVRQAIRLGMVALAKSGKWSRQVAVLEALHADWRKNRVGRREPCR